MKFYAVALSVFVVSALSGCTSLKVINPGGCGSNDHDSICLGKTNVPSEQVNLFLKASKQAVDAVASDEFRDDLTDFVKRHSGSGGHSSAWQGVEADTIPNRLLDEIQGMQISTFGGIKGLFYKLCCGTKAFEGDGVGPILVNRWSLPRSSASIANTIVHEAAHRIGLTHPHSSTNTDIANCEPPYLIGSLVEKQIPGAEWNPDGDCSLLQ